MDQIILSHQRSERGFRCYASLTEQTIEPFYFIKDISSLQLFGAGLTRSPEVGIVLNGKHHGYAVFYYDDGSVEMELVFAEGVKNGPWRRYHPNGQLREEGFYANDKEMGFWTTWYSNGVKCSEGHYWEGKMVGHWLEYFLNGELAEEKKKYLTGKRFYF